MTTHPINDVDRNTMGATRSRTVTWSDPVPVAAQGLSMNGIDYLRAMMSGELPLPPISALMGMRFVAVEPGRVVVACVPDESVYGPIGAVHGGAICTLLDTVAGCALHTMMTPGQGFTSIEIKVNYLRGVRTDSGQLTATGTVVKCGSRVGFTDGVLTDASGAVVATATSALLIFDM